MWTDRQTDGPMDQRTDAGATTIYTHIFLWANKNVSLLHSRMNSRGSYLARAQKNIYKGRVKKKRNYIGKTKIKKSKWYIYLHNRISKLKSGTKVGVGRPVS